MKMNENVANGPWIMAQIVRIRTLESEVRNLLASRGPSGSVLNLRMEELKVQLALLDLSIG
jgi:hypothetical protein